MSSANIWWLLDEINDNLYMSSWLVLIFVISYSSFKKRIKSYFSEMSILDYFYSRINPALQKNIGINQSITIKIGISQIVYTLLKEVAKKPEICLSYFGNVCD